MRKISLDNPGVVIALMLLASTVMLHACWDAPFYKVDDRGAVLPAAKNLNDLSVNGRACYPVILFSFKLDYELFADKTVPAEQGFALDRPTAWAAGSRIMNALYHTLAGFILWRLLIALGISRGLSLFVALAWVAHPMALESVAWICERKNVLCVLFAFSSMLAWSHYYDRPLFSPLVLGLFALAIFSKGSSTGLLPVYVIIALAVMKRDGKSWRDPASWKKPLIGLLGLAGLSVLGLSYTYRTFQQDIMPPPGGSTFTALLTDVEVVCRYIVSIVAPFGLSFYYGIVPITTLADLRLLTFGVPLLAFIAACAWLIPPERRLLALFGASLFFCGLAPHANLVSSSFLMQDRFVYMGMPGVLLALAFACEGLSQRQPAFGRMMPLLPALLLAGLIGLSAWRSSTFSDSDSVELDAARREPGSAYAQLAAAKIFKARAFENAPDGPAPETDVFKTYVAAAIAKFDAALKAPDFNAFGNPFTVRLWKMEMLILAGRLDDARAAIDGWLPPPGLKLLPAANMMTELPTRQVMYTGYRPEALAHAWALMAETSLRASASPKLAAEQRMELCRRGVEEAEKSTAAHVNDYEGQLTKARILLRLSTLLTAANIEQARQSFDDAAAILRAIPKESSNARAAADILNHVTRP